MRKRGSIASTVKQQWDILRVLGNGYRHTISDLALRLGIHKEAVRRHINALQSVGFKIKKEPSPFHDQRMLWSFDKAAQDQETP